MTGASSPAPHESNPPLTAGTHSRRALVADLERRINDLTRADESEFGHFTSTDWVLCVVGFVVLPYLLFLIFWP